MSKVTHREYKRVRQFTESSSKFTMAIWHIGLFPFLFLLIIFCVLAPLKQTSISLSIYMALSFVFFLLGGPVRVGRGFRLRPLGLAQRGPRRPVERMGRSLPTSTWSSSSRCAGSHTAVYLRAFPQMTDLGRSYGFAFIFIFISCRLLEQEHALHLFRA